MTAQCEAVLDGLTAGALSEGAQAHARACPHCRAVVAAYRETETAAAASQTVELPSAATLQSIRKKTGEELASHPKVISWKKHCAWAMTAYFAVGSLGAVVLGVRWSQLRGTDALTLWAAGALLMIVMGLGVFLGFAPGRRAVLKLFIPLAMVSTFFVIFSGTSVTTVKTFLQEGIPCMTTEVAMSLLPLAIAAWALIQSAFNLARTMALGFAASATGLMTLHMHCEQGQWEHVFIFHVFPAVALILLLVAIRRALPTRSYAP